MIGRLRGLLAAKDPGIVILDVGGVGYEVAVTPRALAELPSIGDEAVLHTHMHVREDNMSLFGFPTAPERDLFRVLIGISGVGPKVGMAMLGTLSPDEIRRAVIADDTTTLTSVPGIGKRSAQKLILELRPKLEVPDTDVVVGGPLADVRQALEGLGYSPPEIRSALTDLAYDGEPEDLLRLALQRLGQPGG
ncbi:MAG: Holliday junction branch migration protein RuvA [Acidimicrobiia bacterium]|nr:Holliday junction branch migration protein RuvA [Acidimicrobiia bacterium]